LNSQFILLAAAIFAAVMVQTTAGFGVALLAMSVLPHFFPIAFVSPLVALVLLFSSVLLFFKFRFSFTVRRVLPLFIGAVAGVPFGVLVLGAVSEAVLRVVLAAAVFGFSAYSLAGRVPAMNIHGRWGYLFGFVSGCLGGAINVNGPPVVIYVGLKSWTKDEIVITLQSLFGASWLLIVITHSLHGAVTGRVLVGFAALTPVVLLGVAAGTFLYRRVNLENFKKLLYLLLIILSATLLIR